MKLYHGSTVDIEEIDFSMSKPNKDLYGERNNMETFLQNLKYMKGVTFQYFFGTEKAIKLLRKL